MVILRKIVIVMQCHQLLARTNLFGEIPLVLQPQHSFQQVKYRLFHLN